jgi:hypothetical protein
LRPAAVCITSSHGHAAILLSDNVGAIAAVAEKKSADRIFVCERSFRWNWLSEDAATPSNALSRGLIGIASLDPPLKQSSLCDRRD